MIEQIRYYFCSTYRRKNIDKELLKTSGLYKGKVIDIGGINIGKFRKPKDDVTEWIYADIDPSYNPDIVLDIADMKTIENASFDFIIATEVFEHVEHPEKGLGECSRILKKGGSIIVSMPFSFPIHSKADFQRWTLSKWHKEFSECNMDIEYQSVNGNFFTVFMDMIRSFVKIIPFEPVRWLFYVFYPIMDIIIKLDSSKLVQRSRLKNYTTGYFFIATKK